MLLLTAIDDGNQPKQFLSHSSDLLVQSLYWQPLIHTWSIAGLALDVENEEPDSSLCLNSIIDSQNQSYFDYNKCRIQNDGSCSSPARTLQDNGALDRMCP